MARQILSFLIKTLLLGTSASAFAATVSLQDGDLKRYLNAKSPQYNAIISPGEGVKEGYSRFVDQYATFVYSQTDTFESDSPLESIWRKQQSLGVKKKFGWGVDTNLSYTYRYEKLGPSAPLNLAGQELYIPLLNMDLEVDLWKNFLGRLDKAKRQNLVQKLKTSQIHSKLQLNTFHLQLRSLYWSLVSQERRIKIFEDLVRATKVAYREMQSRLRDNVADPGNVANMAATVSKAEADHRTAVIQRNFIERELKTLIPELQKFDIKVNSDYSLIRKTIRKCVSCAQSMGRMREIPLQYTEYDELINSLVGELNLKLKELEEYDSLDIKFNLKGNSFGFDPDSGEAISQPFSFDTTQYQAMVTATMPLGNPANTRVISIANEKRMVAIEKEKISADFFAAHQNLQRNFGPLERAVDLYHKSIKEQKRAFKNTQKKFRQGRISVIEYISDQNRLLTSKLEVLAIEEKIITEMLKYYMTYNLAPCDFNRI